MHASWMVAAFEVSGIVGLLLGGVLDRDVVWIQERATRRLSR